MKKAIYSILICIMLLFTFCISAFAEDVSDSGNGMTNVKFANGYVGFCIDSQKHGTSNGDTFTPAQDTTVATNNRDNSDISQKLKIMFTQCFDMIFTPDGNGSYYITKDVADTGLQSAIYSFSDNYWASGLAKTLVNAVNDYTGPDIPDTGYQITAENGDIITFYFTVMEPHKEDQQSFFAYKIEVSQDTEHKHDYSDEWSSDDDNHWHECECGDKIDEGSHSGNTADCSNPSVCETCKKELAPVDSDNHTGETEVKNQKDATEYEDGYTGDIYCKDCKELIESGEVIPAEHKHDYSDEWSSDDDNHWHECECGDKIDEDSHSGNTADCSNPSVCETCKKELAPVDSDNHTGETEVKNQKDATEYEDGYTGDIYCKDCEELIESGEVIPAKHKHDYSDEWSSDDDNHWHECECGDKTDEDSHSGNTADCSNPSVCETCKKELAPVDSDNHTGETEVKNQKDATEYEDGYTGDIYCKDCEDLIESGEVIPAKHKHDYSDEWSSDDDNHWHECECGDKTDEDSHSGNTADCSNPSVCETCKKELAPVDSDNHTGETEVKNQKDATEYEDGYTGDIYCKDCEELIKSGEVIPAKHKHDYSDEWSSDDDNHWHECECGDKTDKGSHSFEDGICSTCGLTVEEDKPTSGNNNSSESGSDDTIIIVPVIKPDADGDAEDGTISSPAEDSENNITEDEIISEDEYINSTMPDTGSEDIMYVYFILAAGFVLMMISVSRKKLDSES